MKMKCLSRSLMAASLLTTGLLPPAGAAEVDATAAKIDVVVALPVKHVLPSILAWWIDKDHQVAPQAYPGPKAFFESPTAPRNTYPINPRSGSAEFLSIPAMSLPGVESFVPNDRSHELWVRGTAAGVDHLRTVVASLDKPIQRVMLQMTVAEMAVDDALSLSVPATAKEVLTKPLLMKPSYSSDLQKLEAARRATSLKHQQVELWHTAATELTSKIGWPAEAAASVAPTVNDDDSITLAFDTVTPAALKVKDGATAAVRLPELEAKLKSQRPIFGFVTVRIIRYVDDPLVASWIVETPAGVIWPRSK